MIFTKSVARNAGKRCLSALPEKRTMTSVIHTIREAPSLMVVNLFLVMPAQAGKVFDFNATLPVMAAQFLLLMLFLDKTWFGPVGEVLDERDATIRNHLF